MICWYCRKLFFPLSYFWTKSKKDDWELFGKMCMRCAIPLTVHEENQNVLLFIKKSGLFQVGEYLLGEIVVLLVLLIWWKSHQAVRVVAMAGFFKHRWHIMWWVILWYLILISLHNVCSKFIQSTQTDYGGSIYGCTWWELK